MSELQGFDWFKCPKFFQTPFKTFFLTNLSKIFSKFIFFDSNNLNSLKMAGPSTFEKEISGRKKENSKIFLNLSQKQKLRKN